MEQMKVYEENSFTRYEHLPMHLRQTYWLDYLNRLVQFSLYDPDLSPEKHDRLLSEIRHVTAIIKLLQNEPNHRTIESKATAKPRSQATPVPAAYPGSNPNVRTSSKRRAAQRRNRKSTPARSDNRK